MPVCGPGSIAKIVNELTCQGYCRYAGEVMHQKQVDIVETYLEPPCTP